MNKPVITVKVVEGKPVFITHRKPQPKPAPTYTQLNLFEDGRK